MLFAVLGQGVLSQDLCQVNRRKKNTDHTGIMKSTFTLPTASKNILSDNITGLDLIGACITGLDLIGA